MSAEAPDAAAPVEPSSLAPRTVLWGILLLTALAFVPTLRYGFVYDDSWTIVSNGFLRAPELGMLWSSAGAEANVPDAFRPTLVLFDIVAFQLFGLHALPHHLLSIVLHLGVCALAFHLLGRWGASLTLRGVAVALYAVLAVHAEPVTVISFREDLLAALLGLGALAAAELSLDRRPVLGTLGALVLFALACGAKLSAAPLPGVFVLVHVLRPFGAARVDKRRLAIATTALGLGIVLAIAQTWGVHGSLSPYAPTDPRLLVNRVGLGPVLAGSVQIHLAYLGDLLVPFDLRPEHVDFGASWSDGRTLLGLAAGFALVAASVWGWRRRRAPALAFAILGTALLMIPTSNVVGLPNMRADRFLYLSSLPACVGMAWGALALGERLATGGRGPEFALAPALALFVFQASALIAACVPYASNTTLWMAAVRKTPESSRAQALAALHRLSRGGDRASRDPELLRSVERGCARALALDERDALGQLCVARLATAQKQWERAHEAFLRAADLAPHRADRALSGAAQTALDLNLPEAERTRRAVQLAERATREFPFSPDAHAARARIHHQIGDPDPGLAAYRRASELRPDRWETVAGAVELALDLGDAPAAQRTFVQYEKVLERADEPVRIELRRRLALARHHSEFSLLHSITTPGVLP